MNIKKYIDCDQFQTIILDLITTNKYREWINNTIYENSKTFEAGVIYGLNLAAILIINCDSYYLRDDNEEGVRK